MPDRRSAAVATLAVGLNLAVLYAPRAPAVATAGVPVDKVVHVVVFALPTVALARAGVPRGWAVGVMALHAPISEAIQHNLLSDRSGELGDIVADLVGVGIGAAVLWWPRRGSQGSAADAHPGEPGRPRVA
jgi:hypothetical protein